MKILGYIFLVCTLLGVTGCVTKPRVVKSPCVQSSETAVPCIRRPVNNWLA